MEQRAEMSFQDVIDVIREESEKDRGEQKKQGQLDRNSGTHSIKSQKEILVSGFDRLEMVFSSISNVLGKQVEAMHEANRLHKESLADQARGDRLGPKYGGEGIRIIEGLKAWFKEGFLPAMSETLSAGFSKIKEGIGGGLGLFAKIAKLGIIGVVGAKFIQGLLDELTDGKFSTNLSMLWETLGNWKDRLASAGEFFGEKWEAFAEKFPWMAEKFEEFGKALATAAITLGAIGLMVGPLRIFKRGIVGVGRMLGVGSILRKAVGGLGKLLGSGKGGLAKAVALTVGALGTAAATVKGFMANADKPRNHPPKTTADAKTPMLETPDTKPTVPTAPTTSEADLGKLDDKTATKMVTESIGKVVSKSVPILEWVAGLGLAARHALHGEWGGMAMEGGLLFGAGPLAAAGDVGKVIAYDLPREIYKERFGVSHAQDESPDRDKRWRWATHQAEKLGEQIIEMLDKNESTTPQQQIEELRKEFNLLNDPQSKATEQIKRLLNNSELQYNHVPRSDHRTKEFNQMIAEEDQAFAVPVPRAESYLKRLGSVAQASDFQKKPTVIQHDNSDRSTTIINNVRPDGAGLFGSFIAKTRTLWGQHDTTQ